MPLHAVHAGSLNMRLQHRQDEVVRLSPDVRGKCCTVGGRELISKRCAGRPAPHKAYNMPHVHHPKRSVRRRPEHYVITDSDRCNYKRIYLPCRYNTLLQRRVNAVTAHSNLMTHTSQDDDLIPGTTASTILFIYFGCCIVLFFYFFDEMKFHCNVECGLLAAATTFKDSSYVVDCKLQS